MINSGKTQQEVVYDIEKYYTRLATNCDQEILQLQEQFQFGKACMRDDLANEVVLKANDL